MATPIGAMTHCPLIPIVPYTVQCNQQTITLSCKVNEGAQNVPCYVKCKEKALFCDQADTKYILHTIKEFSNVCTTDHLTITTSPLSFHFLHQCLGGAVWDNWNLAKQDQPNMLVSLDASIDLFIRNYLKTSSLHEQMT